MGTEMNEAIEINLGTLKFEGNPAKLYEALAKAQLGFTPIPRSKPGQSGNRNFKYADYATIMRCIRPALAEHGITILQPLHSNDGQAVTTTILAGHGAAIISSLSFPTQRDPQEFGKHHTYYRRYQLQSMLGLEGDKDADDLPDVNEEHAQQQGYTEPAQPKKEPKVSPKANGASAKKESAAASDQKTEPSVKSSETSTDSSSSEQPSDKGQPVKASAAATIDSIPEAKLNAVLSAIMKQMDPPWRLFNVREFYSEHFGAKPEDMPHPDNMPAPLKRQILTKLVEVKNVAPF